MVVGQVTDASQLLKLNYKVTEITTLPNEKKGTLVLKTLECQLTIDSVKQSKWFFIQPLLTNIKVTNTQTVKYMKNAGISTSYNNSKSQSPLKLKQKEKLPWSSLHCCHEMEISGI